MITRDKLADMDAGARTKAFLDMVEIVYGTRKPKQADVAYDLDITPITWRKWIREDAVPVWAILLMTEWALRGQDARKELLEWTEITDKLSEITQRLRNLAVIRAASWSDTASADPDTCPESQKSSGA